MLYIRNIIFWIGLILSTTFFFIILMLMAPLPWQSRKKLPRHWAKSLMYLFEHVIGLTYEVIDAHHTPTEPCVIASKHQSGWETISLHSIFPPQVFVAKRELLWIPIFGWGLYFSNQITINRKDKSNATRLMMEQGLDRKNKGYWITVFPEGTRVKPGQKGHYKLGASRIAKTLDMPMLPIAHNAGEFWPRNGFIKHPGKITVIVGKPLYPKDFENAETMMKACATWIEEQQDHIGGQGPCADPAQKLHRMSTDWNV